MVNINKKIQVGTKVKIEGINNWHVVKDRTTTLIKLDGFLGSFQSGHIIKYTNC